MPGTAKVLGSNLISACFFLTVNFRFKKMSHIICLLIFHRLRCHILVFLLNALFILVVFSFISPAICNSTKLDFVYFFSLQIFFDQLFVCFSVVSSVVTSWN